MLPPGKSAVAAAPRGRGPQWAALNCSASVDPASATVAASGEMAEVMAPFLPAGISYADLLSGVADPAAVTPDAPLTNETYDAWRARFRGQPGGRTP